MHLLFKYINDDIYLIKEGYSEYELPLDDNSFNNVDIDHQKGIEERYDIRNGEKVHYKKKILTRTKLKKLEDVVNGFSINDNID